jgi:hypothetical protein
MSTSTSIRIIIPTHRTFPTLHHAPSTVLISVSSTPVSLSCSRISLQMLISFVTDGFFDAGMLRQALNANRNNNDAAVEPAVDREVVKRNVGRRLRLSEY